MIGNSTDHSHISVSNSTLNLTSTPVSGQPPSVDGPAINYFSGTIYAKEQINVDGVNAVGYQLEGEFSSPTAVGTWPACKFVI